MSTVVAQGRIIKLSFGQRDGDVSPLTITFDNDTEVVQHVQWGKMTWGNEEVDMEYASQMIAQAMSADSAYFAISKLVKVVDGPKMGSDDGAESAHLASDDDVEEDDISSEDDEEGETDDFDYYGDGDDDDESEDEEPDVGESGFTRARGEVEDDEEATGEDKEIENLVSDDEDDEDDK